MEQRAQYFRKSPELMGAEIGEFHRHLLQEKKLAKVAQQRAAFSGQLFAWSAKNLDSSLLAAAPRMP